MHSAGYLFTVLVVSIVFIVWATAIRKMNAFFALLLAALGVGVLGGIELERLPHVLRAGFGLTMEKVGLLILLGTVLGVILEKTGATLSMANAILRMVRERNAPAAMSITGFIVGLPVFCDSGFIILSGLNHSLVKRTHFTMPVMASALATSLYAVHCLVPPHPGITAAAGAAGAETGMVMLVGVLVAIPVALTGYLFSLRGKKIADALPSENLDQEAKQGPSFALSFLPVIVPVLLIALKSVLQLLITPDQWQTSLMLRVLSFLGDPAMALGAGIVLALPLIVNHPRHTLTKWMGEGVEKAGMILAIIAAGGMFAEMLRETGVANSLGESLGGVSLGIFFPFMVAAVIKTAQGSSTVAVIAAASIITPLLPELGLANATGTTLAVLSMGAGSMLVSHPNDSYFWVISRFSDLDTSTTLRTYSAATVIMAVVAQVIIWVAAHFFV